MAYPLLDLQSHYRADLHWYGYGTGLCLACSLPGGFSCPVAFGRDDDDDGCASTPCPPIFNKHTHDLRPLSLS